MNNLNSAAFFNYFPDGSFIIIDGLIADCNPAAERIFRGKKIQLTGKSIESLFPDLQPDGRSASEIVFEIYRQGAGTSEHPFRCISHRFDGTSFQSQISLIKADLEGQNSFFVCFHEIEQLPGEKYQDRDSEYKFRILTESMKDVVWTMNPYTLRFLYVSPSVYQLRGYTPEEIIAEPATEALTPEGATFLRNQFQNNINEFLSYGTTEPFHRSNELEQPCKDGSSVWTEVVTTFYLNKDNGQVEVMGVTRDITDRKIAEKKIAKVAQHYQAIIENAPDGIALVDAAGNFKFVSPSGRRIFGYNPTEGITQNPATLTHPDDLGMVLSNLSRLIEDASYTPTLQYRFQTKDGAWSWVESTFTNLLKDPNVESIVINFRDISQQKQADLALRESEEKFRELADFLPQVIFETDIQGNFVFVNRQAFKIFGYPYDYQIIGLNSLRFHIPEGRERARENIQALLSGIPVQGNEYTMLKQDGSTFPGLIYSNLILKDNKPAGLRGIIVDISDRKLAEKRLHESEQRYRLLVETANEGILVGQGSELKFVNPMIQELTGYSEEYLLSQPFLDFIHPLDRDLILQNQAKRLKGEAIDLRYQIRILRKDQTIKWVEMGGVKIEWDGKPATMNFITDITERKKAEEEIKLQNIKLQKINAEKDKFFSIISHDLRSPFSGFLGLTQIMTEELPTLTMDEIRDIAESLRNSAINVFRLLENLLQWSLIHQGLTPFDQKQAELHPIVQESISVALESSGIKEIEIVNDVEDTLMVYADHQLLQTILRNLISNAVKFTSKGGKVTITAKVSNENWVEIKIQDTGIGISPAMIADLFRMDVQTGRKGTEGEASTGLGLLLCKEFVERHGGELWVESVVGKGSSFYFTVPATLTY